MTNTKISNPITNAEESVSPTSLQSVPSPEPLRLTLLTPGDNATLELPEVPPQATPAEIVEQLVAEGFLPALPAGVGYVLALRGTEVQLDDGESLSANQVPSGATLQIFTTSPGAASEAFRRERLRGDASEMQNIRGALIDWTPLEGEPPTAYRVVYRLPSYVRTATSLERREVHQVIFELGARYPEAPPKVKMLDRPAVFHPNISAIGGICIGYWSLGLEEGLGFLVIRVAKMLLYYDGVSNPRHACNPQAATWYLENQRRGALPLLRVAFPDPHTGISAERRRIAVVRREA